jgi:hypothetical protein
MRSRNIGPCMIRLWALSFCLGGCVAGTQNPGGERNLITAREIESTEVSNAYGLIQRLRPLWLRSRGGRSTRLETEIVVYVNESMLGGIDALRDIPIEIVESVWALDSAEAGRLPGLGSRHVERAIMVVTRALFLRDPKGRPNPQS